MGADYAGVFTCRICPAIKIWLCYTAYEGWWGFCLAAVREQAVCWVPDYNCPNSVATVWALQGYLCGFEGVSTLRAF